MLDLRREFGRAVARNRMETGLRLRTGREETVIADTEHGSSWTLFLQNFPQPGSPDTWVLHKFDPSEEAGPVGGPNLYFTSETAARSVLAWKREWEDSRPLFLRTRRLLWRIKCWRA